MVMLVTIPGAQYAQSGLLANCGELLRGAAPVDGNRVLVAVPGARPGPQDTHGSADKNARSADKNARVGTQERTGRRARTHGSAARTARRRGWLGSWSADERGGGAAAEVRGRRMRWPTRGEAWRAGAYVLAWLLIAVPVALLLFFTSSASTTLASHDATVRPTADGYVTLRTGPFLPDVRAPSGGRVGVEITLGKTEARSTEELVERYAFIASQPDAQVARVQRVLTDLAYDAALRGAVIARGAAHRLGAGREAKARRAARPSRRPPPLRSAAHRGAPAGAPGGAHRPAVEVQRPDAGRLLELEGARGLRPRGHHPGGGQRDPGLHQLDDQQHQAAGAQRHRHVPEEQGVLRGRRQRGRGPGAAPARGGRDRRPAGLGPARQHRHGPGRPRDRGPGGRHRHPQRGRRHLDRLGLGGVQPRLPRQRLR